MIFLTPYGIISESSEMARSILRFSYSQPSCASAVGYCVMCRYHLWDMHTPSYGEHMYLTFIFLHSIITATIINSRTPAFCIGFFAF